MATVSQQIQQVYIGLLGRAADQEGLNYWTNEIDSGAITLEQVRANIVNEQPEYAEGQGTLTRSQTVSDLYQNLFERAPDDEGLDYWVNGGGATVNVDQLVLALAEGAAASDTLVLDNKVQVAQYYTQEAGADFSVSAAAAAVANVDASAASVQEAKQAIDSGSVTNDGETFTLTDAVGEVVNGTAQNDTFSAVVNGTTQAEGTLNTGDQINGKGGNDTLNLLVSEAGTLPAGVSVQNVETININQQTAALTSINAASFAGAQQIWQVEDSTAITGLSEGQTAGFRDTATADVTYGANAETAAVALDNVDTASSTIISGDALTTVNLSGTVAANGTDAGTLGVTLTNSGNGEITTVNAAFESDVVLNNVDGAAFVGADATVTTLNASESTGDLTIDLSGIQDAGSNSFDVLALESLTTGAGDDTLTADLVSFAAEQVALNAGAGSDTVTLDLNAYNLAADANADATAVSVTLGAGNDSLDLNLSQGTTATETRGNIVDSTEANFQASMFTVTDFDAGNDVLDIAGFVSGTKATQNAVNGAVNADSVDSLFAAVTAAAGETGAGNYAMFDYEGSAYVYSDANGDASFSNGDGLVELAGISYTDLSGDNMVA